MQIPDWFYRRVWFASADVVLYQFGLPVGSTVLVAASESGGSWGFGLSERREGVYSEAPGMFPVWTDLSIQVGKQSMLVKKKKKFGMHPVNSPRQPNIKISLPS